MFEVDISLERVEWAERTVFRVWGDCEGLRAGRNGKRWDIRIARKSKWSNIG
jgi:hypothetical protein